MAIADIVILVILLVSVVSATMAGTIKSTLHLIVALIGIWAGLTYAEWLADYSSVIATLPESLVLPLSALAIFFVVGFIGRIAIRVIGLMPMLAAVGNIFGYLIGGGLGLARGIVFLVVLIVMSGFLRPEILQETWEKSQVLPILGIVSSKVTALAPYDSENILVSQIATMTYSDRYHQPMLATPEQLEEEDGKAPVTDLSVEEGSEAVIDDIKKLVDVKKN